MKHPLTVTGMTCGHCEKSVTRTVLRWDPQAQVHIDRAHNHVNVDTDKDITPLLALIATGALSTEGLASASARPELLAGAFLALLATVTSPRVRA
jgi:copper chaperone